MKLPDARVTRDTISYTLGVLGTIYETIFAHGPAGERLPFLIIFVGLLTAPAFLHKDDKTKEESKAKTVSEEEAK